LVFVKIIVMQILAYTAVVIVGSVITGTGVHYFRCTRRDFVGYSDGSTLAYYCPYISEPEAQFILHNINNIEQQYESNPTQFQPPPVISQTDDPNIYQEPPLRLGKKLFSKLFYLFLILVKK